MTINVIFYSGLLSWADYRRNLKYPPEPLYSVGAVDRVPHGAGATGTARRPV